MKTAMEIWKLSEYYGDKKAIAMIKEAGFDGIDYSLFDKIEMLNNENFREYAKELKLFLNENNVMCNQAHAPFNLKYGGKFSPEEKDYSDIVKSIEFASIIGVKNIIVHAIPTPADVDTFNYNYKFYKSLEPYCEKYKIHVAIENLYAEDENFIVSRFMSMPEDIAGLAEKLDSEWFVCCVDVGHAAMTGTSPEAFIKQMNSENLKALHLHDNDGKRDLHQLPYMGSMNWEAITRSLADINYSGDITLEIVGCMERLDAELFPETIKLAARIARLIADKAEDAK